jgi:biopolymer transport protein ExbD
MGGAGTTSNGSRGRRALDAAINLVPFIDLLSCCIAFLLITAVWSQVASVGAQTAGGGPGEAGARPWRLYVDSAQLELWAPNGQRETVELSALPVTLRARNVGDQLLLEAADGVKYERLIRALDQAHAAGIEHIAVPAQTEIADPL